MFSGRISDCLLYGIYKTDVRNSVNPKKAKDGLNNSIHVLHIVTGTWIFAVDH